jgi:hypothetical protein
MKELISKLITKVKSLNKTTIAIIGIFAIVATLNFLGYAG